MPDEAPCVTLDAPQTIPEDGSWLSVCWHDPLAPADGLVTVVNAKVALKHALPADLDVRLTRSDTQISVPLFSDAIDRDGLGRYPDLHAFDGLPAEGEWVLQVRDTVPGNTGDLEVLSLSCLYAIPGQTTQITKGSEVYTALRLPHGFPPPPPDESPEAAFTAEGYVDPLRVESQGHVTITQGFETVFPPSIPPGLPRWDVFDLNLNGGEHYWDDDDYRPYTGSWAVWPAAGGADAIDPGPYVMYPTDMESWMTYGPLDLSQSTWGEYSFWLWYDTEPDYDSVCYGVSTDGVNFPNEICLTGQAGWQEITVDLAPYLGQSVLLGWRFHSDDIVGDLGAWIDDISIEYYEPNDLTVEGTVYYIDRDGAQRPSPGVKIELYDADPGGDDDLLGEAYTDASGHYAFAPQRNWDEDDYSELTPEHRRLDPYVRFLTKNDLSHLRVTTSDDAVYAWRTGDHHNEVGPGVEINPLVTADEGLNLEALWIFGDLYRTRHYYLSHTDPPVDPGWLRAHWAPGQDSEYGIPNSHFMGWGTPHVFIMHGHRNSADTVVHELGHHVMYNLTEYWEPFNWECWSHRMFGEYNETCAWTEGWADYFAITVNENVCFDLGPESCNGDPDVHHYDLEQHSLLDTNPAHLPGDAVEGRVAGALYDLMDMENEWPYDSAWLPEPRMDTIADTAMIPNEPQRFSEFWQIYAPYDPYATGSRHDAVRSVYQNTVNYNTIPWFKVIPDVKTFVNSGRVKVLDLSDYGRDAESLPGELTYFLDDVDPDTGCEVTVASDGVVYARPAWGYEGSCGVMVGVYDSINYNWSGFNVYVDEPASRLFVPMVMAE